MRRTLPLLCAIAGIVTISALVLRQSPRVPRYHGRPVTAWIRDAFSYSATQTQVDQARDAVRAAGTNALPFWMEMLSETNEPRFAGFWNSTIGRKPTYHRLTLSEKWDYALFALYYLGPDAKYGIPELTRLFDRQFPDPASYACILLLNLGPEGVQVVTNALTDTSLIMRGNIALTIGAWSGKPPYPAAIMSSSNWEWPPDVMNAVVPALERCLNDPDPGVRVHSAEALGELRKDPERVVPALARNLSTATNTTERLITLQALGNYWGDGKSARAQVASFLNDTNTDVINAASNALRKIDSGKRPQ